MARKARRLSDQEIAAVENLSSVLTIEQIADYLRMSVTWLYQVRRRDPRLDQALRKGKANGVALAGQQLMAKIQKGHFEAIRFYLRTQGGWSERSTIEQTGPDGGPIQHEMMLGMTDEALAKLSGEELSTLESILRKIQDS